MLKRLTPLAVVSASWKLSEPGKGIGGVHGSAFAVHPDFIVTAHHVVRSLFDIPDGYDRKRVFMLGIGQVSELSSDQIASFPDWDAAIIVGVSPERTHQLSRKAGNRVHSARALGYVGGATPYRLVRDTAGPRPTPISTRSATQSIRLSNLRYVQLDMTNPQDISLSDKPVFYGAGDGLEGASGGPCIDDNNEVIGLNCFGLPPDTARKTSIGAIDVRAFLASNWDALPERFRQDYAWLTSHPA